MNPTLTIENKYLKQIFESIQDGIIIMDHLRTILMMNPSAKRLTGWELGEKVPYCSFCEERKRKHAEDKCYLIAKDEVPYFLSEMPTYHGEKINVEMSTALMFHDQYTGKKEYLLVLRDQRLKRKEEEAYLSKLMIQKLIEVQENEHKRLAQELHDGVGQSLYTISVALQAIEPYVNEKKIADYLSEVRTELDKVMKDVKAYSYQLRPQSLDRLGLIPTIESLISSMTLNRDKPDIFFASDIKQRLPSTVEINLYRVIQEALHNIVKYAKATKVTIELKQQQTALKLLIQDNGVGFDQNTILKGLGLKHMSERVDQINGTFVIETAVGEGTVIHVNIPNEVME